jgi:hypothetical protein
MFAHLPCPVTTVPHVRTSSLVFGAGCSVPSLCVALPSSYPQEEPTHSGSLYTSTYRLWSWSTTACPALSSSWGCVACRYTRDLAATGSTPSSIVVIATLGVVVYLDANSTMYVPGVESHYMGVLLHDVRAAAVTGSRGVLVRV